MPVFKRSLAAVAVSLPFGLLLAAQTGAKPAAPAASTAAAPAGADPVVITVGTEQIRASQFNALVAAAPAENQAAMMANKREVAEELTKMLALEQEAQRRGLDKDPKFVAQMMMTRDNALANSMVEQLRTEDKPTDAQIQAYYDANPAQFMTIKVRHILVGDSESPGGPNPRTQAEAQAKANLLEDRLKKGEDFATIAKAESDDPGSKDKGGDLGDVQPGQTVAEFDAAIKTLPIGTISQPIHSPFGYHIIQVQARTATPLADAKATIADQLSGKTVDAAIDRLTTGSKATINDSFFGPAKPAAPPAGTPHS